MHELDVLSILVGCAHRAQKGGLLGLEEADSVFKAVKSAETRIAALREELAKERHEAEAKVLKAGEPTQMETSTPVSRKKEKI